MQLYQFSGVHSPDAGPRTVRIGASRELLLTEQSDDIIIYVHFLESDMHGRESLPTSSPRSKPSDPFSSAALLHVITQQHRPV